MRVVSFVVFGIAGCGRVAFDPMSDGAIDSAPTMPVCLTNDFNAPTAGWIADEGTWDIVAGEGPDGSPAYVAQNPGAAMIFNADMGAITTAQIHVDFRIDGAMAGDFGLSFVKPGWTRILDETNYVVLLFGVGTDSSPDSISRYDPPGDYVALGTHDVTVPVGTWHTLDVLYRADTSMHVDLDGAPYMDSLPEGTLAGPIDIAIYAWDRGAFDNVIVRCER